MQRMWRRFVILLLMLALPLPSLAAWAGACTPDASPATHAMADMVDEAAAPCCPDVELLGECAQLDCASTAMHFVVPVVRADLGAGAHVLSAAPMPRFTSVTVSRHDRPPIVIA